MSVVLNSALQVAVALVPVLVLVSLFIGGAPFTLAIPPILAAAVFLAVLVVTIVTVDGEADMVDGAALVGLYRDGGGDFAFGELIRRHQIGVFRLLLTILGDPDDAERICEQAFFEAARKLDELADGNAFYAWVAGIARGLAKKRDEEQKKSRVTAPRPRPAPSWGLREDRPAGPPGGNPPRRRSRAAPRRARRGPSACTRRGTPARPTPRRPSTPARPPPDAPSPDCSTRRSAWRADCLTAVQR